MASRPFDYKIRRFMAFTRPGILAAVLAAWSSTVAAQTQPLLTEEATTAPAGTVVFETGFDWIAHEPNYLTETERTRWDGPLLRLVYSPADNVEMDLEWVSAIGVVNDADFGTTTAFGDVSLRAKVRFTDDQTGHAAVGARFAVTLPQTGYGDGLAPNTLRMRVELLVSKRLGPATFHANAGLALADAPTKPHTQADFLSWGAALELRIARPLALLSEANGLVGHGEPGAPERGEARLGLRVGAGRVRADAAARRGLVDETGDWGFTAGLRFRI